MPSSARPGPRTPASPGRGTRRARSRRSTASERGSARPAKTVDATAERPLGRGFNYTRRAVALFVLVLVMAVSYFNSLRVLFDQERQIQAVRYDIQQKKDAIDDLESELKRWQDPAYVKAQARTRLGWVMPGEVGYRVIGANGQPIDTSVQIEQKGSVPPEEVPPHYTWYKTMWGSVEAADSPRPAK